ncbi:MAG TPA: hypothetical protein VN108_06470 [Marmoricola sp.]|nr:hypothetical protein [Marmoricola sp.]
MPTADDLFRPTTPESSPGMQRARLEAVDEKPVPRTAENASEDVPRNVRSSGRIRHDEKMTVYVTADELLDIEHARLSLRRMQGMAVDRGRLVREAIAIALADLEENGDESVLVQRLSAS